MDMVEQKRRLSAIRRLSPGFPTRTAKERLEKIEGIASGKLDPAIVHRAPSANLAERLKAGMASRSKRIQDNRTPEFGAFQQKQKAEREKAAAEKADEKKRKTRFGKDRQERGGRDRSE